MLEPLAVSMPGLKLGDRLLVVGCSDPALVAALGAKVGLTGRACAVDENGQRATEAETVARREGALIETAAAPGWCLPYDDGSFDVVVLRGLVAAGSGAHAAFRESNRVLRPGGRAIVIEGARKRRLGSLMGGGSGDLPTAAEATGALVSAGFAAVRTLAERDGMLFAEGARRNA